MCWTLFLSPLKFNHSPLKNGAWKGIRLPLGCVSGDFFFGAKLPPKFFLPSCKLDWGQNRWQHYLRPGTNRVAQHESPGVDWGCGMGMGYKPSAWKRAMVGWDPNQKPYQKSSWITGKKASRNPSDFLERNRPGFSLQKVRNPNLSDVWLEFLDSISSNFDGKVHQFDKVPMRNLLVKAKNVTEGTTKLSHVLKISSFQQLESEFSIAGLWRYGRKAGKLPACLLRLHYDSSSFLSNNSKARGMEWNLCPNIWDKVGESCYKLKQLMDVSSTND